MKFWSSYSHAVNLNPLFKMRFHLTSMLLLVLAVMVPGKAFSQAMPTPAIPQNMGSGLPGTTIAQRAGATLKVTIVDESKKPLKQQSLIRLTNQSTGLVLFQTSRDAETRFTDLPVAKYLLEVGSIGYFGVHEQIAVNDAAHDVNETVTLGRDPAAVDFKLNDPGHLPSKARKEAEKGVLALELSNFVEARKHLEAANHQFPTSSSINFLLGYIALREKDQERELSYLTAATKLDPSNLQAQNLLGQLYYLRGDYGRAAAAEEIVVASSGESLIARKVLASSYLKLKQWDKARENSQWLVDRGGSEAASARVILGQALAGLGKNEAAIQTLTAYLDEEPGSSVAPQVRNLIAALKRQVSQGGANASTDIRVADPDLESDSELASGNAGMPADIDEQKPAVVAGVQCPANIFESASNPSKSLVDSVSQFSAIEHMVHENISPQGVPRNRQTRQFNYVVSISEAAPGPLMIEEYRDAGGDVPDNIKSTGLAVLAIAFHPYFRDDFEMRCEGLGEWHGQAAWLVHFRQFDDKPSRLRRYVVNGNNFPVRLKGRAWIRVDNLQIIHLETDLVKPIPEIYLLTEHTSVSYGPVQFKRSGTELWLPQSAELYVHFDKRRFHRSETFDHFMLFATDASDKANLPKTDPNHTPTAAPTATPASGPSAGPSTGSTASPTTRPAAGATSSHGVELPPTP
jgi:tetratricopeptide (TPR) repeat protein